MRDIYNNVSGVWWTQVSLVKINIMLTTLILNSLPYNNLYIKFENETILCLTVDNT